MRLGGIVLWLMKQIGNSPVIKFLSVIFFKAEKELLSMKINNLVFFLLLMLLGAHAGYAQTQDKAVSVPSTVSDVEIYSEQSNAEKEFDYLCYRTNDDELSKLPNGFVVIGGATGGVSRIFAEKDKINLLLTFITADPAEGYVTILSDQGSRYQLSEDIAMRIDAVSKAITLVELGSEKGCKAAAALMNSEVAKINGIVGNSAAAGGLLHPGSIATVAGLLAIIAESGDKKNNGQQQLPPIPNPAPASPN